MSTVASPARLAANRANALLSTGPRTAEGKERSRRNSLKHGLTGDGVVVPGEDSAAVEARFASLESEFQPGGEFALMLVRRVALLGVRLERSARQEAAAITDRMLTAEADFDEARRAEADHLHHYIGASPATNHRRLLATPEGVDRLVVAWLELKKVLDYPGEIRWDYVNYMTADFLCGRDSGLISEYQALTFAMKGKFEYLKPDDGAGLSDADRRHWARREVGRRIDAEIAGLLAHRETIDTRSIAIRRAGAADRALFDPSKEAILARKYEAATERALFRILREIRDSRDIVAEPEPAAEPETVAPEPADRGSLASFFPDASAGPDLAQDGPTFRLPDEEEGETAAKVDAKGLDSTSLSGG